MKKILALNLILLAGYLPVDPSQAIASQQESTAWDRFYGGYDVTFKDWKHLSGVEFHSHTNGDPDIAQKPRLNSVEHRGTLGIRLPENWAILNGSNPRLEGGGASDEGTYKSQFDTGPEFSAPIIIKLKNPSTTAISATGLGIYSLNSYTFSQLNREFFINYKLDYNLNPSLAMSPKIGYVYSNLRQTHHNFLNAPQFESYAEYTEQVRNHAHGVRTGLDLETPIGGGFDLLFGVQYTLSYNETDLRVDVFDFVDGYLYVEDGSNVLSRTTDLTLGLRKDLWGAVLTVTAGISFYSDMPRVVNPIKVSDMDAHLEYLSAHSEFVRVSIAYAV